MKENAQSLSQADHRILTTLQNDATLSLKELAEATHLSASTVWRRMQDLEAAGVIRDRVALLDPEKLGLGVCTLVHVNISSQTPETRRAFEAFVDLHDTILQCFAVTGEQDYMLVLRSRTVADFERFLMDQLLAHPSVASSSSQLVLRHHKNSTALPLGIG
ncbi:Lrp/AsnC family transcriptional regulator [Actibacterium sp. 188UL27-1]|uniref:Lrp/AsnC family transcriptional regulator n=1 Tax=Actibacterium sp. 188UL27-1 TaxID=2786961 RepID=UPI00195E4A4B|nr:Lrp/AsnC family transcriptional regulator [Actibacterium sp. 188UL27-1]MBM7069341.1 Lrp/AsnC family transcriptional regulator [Actibacterium sp. 188UL27-1]